jgi:serine/threonine-protein kinase
MSLPEIGTVLDDKYVIEAKLGQGGMAAVYRARHRYTHRMVAIKVLLPSIARDATVVERFLREARAAIELDHPAVVAVLDVGRAAQGYYLVMEHLERETLRARLARGPLGEAKALAVWSRCCRPCPSRMRTGSSTATSSPTTSS